MPPSKLAPFLVSAFHLQGPFTCIISFETHPKVMRRAGLIQPHSWKETEMQKGVEPRLEQESSSPSVPCRPLHVTHGRSRSPSPPPLH